VSPSENRLTRGTPHLILLQFITDLRDIPDRSVVPAEISLAEEEG